MLNIILLSVIRLILVVSLCAACCNAERCIILSVVLSLKTL